MTKTCAENSSDGSLSVRFGEHNLSASGSGPVEASPSKSESGGAVVALAVRKSAGALSLEPAWASGAIASPATPLIVILLPG